MAPTAQLQVSYNFEAMGRLVTLIDNQQSPVRYIREVQYNPAGQSPR